MYTEQDFEAAIAAGVIDRPTVERLRHHFAGSRGAPLADEEQFRLLSGFNDIFVSIATLLLLAALFWLGQALPLGSRAAANAVGGALVAATAWGLAEYFTRRRRMALPSILLLLGFVAGLCGAVFWSIEVGLTPPGVAPGEAPHHALVLAATAAAAAVGALAHWRRFHVPITVAVASAGVVALALSLLTAAVPGAADHRAALGLVAGLLVFALALRWDLSDPRRQTRRADVAFWLHLLAAPLIIHSAFALSGLLRGSVGGAEAALVVLIYVALAVLALVIDRRALMVSALAYVLYALSALFHSLGASSLNVALTALVLGSALLTLSAFWPRLRRTIVALLPRGLRARLPPAVPPAFP